MRAEGSAHERVAPTLSLTVITSQLSLFTAVDVLLSPQQSSQSMQASAVPVVILMADVDR